jgi:argininosuccinate lyase
MHKRLWDKNTEIDLAVHGFTVGTDPEIDLHLAKWDVLASAAHAQVLFQNGVLSRAEVEALLAALKQILARIAEGDFHIPFELEDGHTAIEAQLTQQLGAVGKKIHTGRSRNDQVLVAIRLYLKFQILELLKLLERVIEAHLACYQQHHQIPMPGYTHLQQAMPSSVGMWLHAHAEGFAAVYETGLLLLESIDTCPLGVGAGFGLPLDMHRTLSAQLLGFTRPQRNPIHAQNTRGLYELRVLNWCKEIAHNIEKMSWDLILFSTQEFGFFKLPERLTTGSSIMPQKRNPDVLELLRASASKVRSSAFELESVISKLPSHYHRDFQYSKEPLVRGVQTTQASLAILPELLNSLAPNSDRLTAACQTPELYATFEAYRLVKQGMPFRQAYQEAAERYRAGQIDIAGLRDEYLLIAQTQQHEFADFIGALKPLLARGAQQSQRFEQIETRVFALLEK